MKHFICYCFSMNLHSLIICFLTFVVFSFWAAYWREWSVLMSNGGQYLVISGWSQELYETRGRHEICQRNDWCTTKGGKRNNVQTKQWSSAELKKDTRNNMQDNNIELNERPDDNWWVWEVYAIRNKLYKPFSDWSTDAIKINQPKHATAHQPSEISTLDRLDALYVWWNEYTDQDKELIEDWMNWADILTGTPYKLWGKNKQAIDCSGLLSVYASERWVRDNAFTLQSLNSTTLSYLWRDKEVKKLERWDVLYRKNTKWWINHISIVVKNNYPKFTIMDASYSKWVSKREITVNNWIIDAWWWHTYRATGHMNPIVEIARKFWYKENLIDASKHVKPKPQPKTVSSETYLGKWHSTSYCSPSTWYYKKWESINCLWWCDETANWFKLKQRMKDTIVACDDSEWKYWTKFRFVHPKLGSKVVTCQDTWSAIVWKLRFDLWNWIWQAACTEARWQTYHWVDVYLIK